ncbi:MAG: hypothetical protein R3D00_27030 [Bacteroidia bacterium]
MSAKKHIPGSKYEAEPSVVMLRRYLNGETTETENARIEAQLAEDPLLADALDGLMLVKDNNSVILSVSRIKAASRKRLFTRANRREMLSRRKSRVSMPENFPMIFVATAAAITLLFATFFVVRDLGFNQNEPPAIAESYTTDENPPVVTETSPAITETSPIESEPLVASAEVSETPVTNRLSVRRDRIIAEKPVSTSSGALTTLPAGPTPHAAPAIMPGESLAVGKENVDMDDVQPRDRRSDQMREETAGGIVILSDSLGEYMKQEQVSAIPITKSNPAPSANGVLPPSLSTSEQAKYDDHGKLLKSVAMADLLTEAIALHDTQKYAAAREKLDEVLQSEPQNQVAQYYKASTFFYQGLYRESITLLKILARAPESLLFEESQWLLAQNYSLSGRKKTAIRLLNEIEAAGGKYQEEARKLRESYGENR